SAATSASNAAGSANSASQSAGVSARAAGASGGKNLVTSPAGADDWDLGTTTGTSSFNVGPHLRFVAGARQTVGYTGNINGRIYRFTGRIRTTSMEPGAGNFRLGFRHPTTGEVVAMGPAFEAGMTWTYFDFDLGIPVDTTAYTPGVRFALSAPYG